MKLCIPCLVTKFLQEFIVHSIVTIYTLLITLTQHKYMIVFREVLVQIYRWHYNWLHYRISGDEMNVILSKPNKNKRKRRNYKDMDMNLPYVLLYMFLFKFWDVYQKANRSLLFGKQTNLIYHFLSMIFNE